MQFKRALSSREYQKYLKSAHWRSVRKRYWASKMLKTCYICGATEKLALHHKTYKNLGHERLMDLVPLCFQCHSEVHKALREATSQKTNLWNISKKLKKARERRLKSNRARRSQRK